LICIVVAVAIYRLRKEVRMRNINLRDKNEELQEALSELEENVSLKEKLISLILHDLKTPLYFQSLLFSQIVEADYFSNSEGRELFRELKNSSAGILRFTKEFLTWYSSQRDGFKVKKTVFDPMLIVEDLFAVYKDIAAKKNVTLQCDAGGMTSLFTDRNILEIVIRNLLDNALKYTAAGSVALIFERRADADAITVADTGKGMTIDKIKMLEGHSNMTRRQSSETFGYRFIFTMARKIDAGIHITSSPGKGTSVTIVIPRQAAEELAAHLDISPI
jgi:signal transduction histidine kinase